MKEVKQEKGNGVEFRVLTFNQRGDLFVLHTADNQENAMRWLDLVVEKITKGKVSIWSELNDLQRDCINEQTEETIFPDKTKIPLAIVNLILKEYGVWIVKHEPRSNS